MYLRIHHGPTSIWIFSDEASFRACSHLPTAYLRMENASGHLLEMLIATHDAKEEKDYIIIDNDPQNVLRQVSGHFECIDAAGGLIQDLQGRFLFIFRRGYWDLPKGKLDPGESLEQCALREINEETGLHQVSLSQKICTTYHIYQQENRRILKASHWYAMYFTGNEEAVPQTEEDIDRIEWLRAEEVSDILPLAYPSIRDVWHSKP